MPRGANRSKRTNNLPTPRSSPTSCPSPARRGSRASSTTLVPRSACGTNGLSRPGRTRAAPTSAATSCGSRPPARRARDAAIAAAGTSHAAHTHFGRAPRPLRVAGCGRLPRRLPQGEDRVRRRPPARRGRERGYVQSHNSEKPERHGRGALRVRAAQAKVGRLLPRQRRELGGSQRVSSPPGPGVEEIPSNRRRL